MVTLTYRIDDGPAQTYTSDLEDPGAAQLDLIMAQPMNEAPWSMDVWIGQDADTTQKPNFRHQHQAAG
jgi:hypothetical protein